MRQIKRYEHPSGETFNCLHCVIERVIERHDWVGNLSPRQIKWMVIKDLLTVLWEVIWYYDGTPDE